MFQLRPWEVERLTGVQVRRLAERIDEMNRESEREAAEARAHG